MCRRIMKRVWLQIAILVAGCGSSWAIYGPWIARADVAVAVRACREAKFTRGGGIANAMKSGQPAQILGVLGDALKEWRATPANSDLYAARAFCIHELVPDHLPPAPSADLATQRLFAPDLSGFEQLGISYFYYGPDGEWILSKDPVDLVQLATKHQDSRWGREAFLMMTRLGWSHGACQEGPDQFREVIKHGEPFLKKYPASEVSDRVRLELANAYATWWNLAQRAQSSIRRPDPYKAGAERAKQRAVALYQMYLRVQRKPPPQVQKWLKALQENPKGSETFDYFCEDYED